MALFPFPAAYVGEQASPILSVVLWQPFSMGILGTHGSAGCFKEQTILIIAYMRFLEGSSGNSTRRLFVMSLGLIPLKAKGCLEMQPSSPSR
jgi:hypothetical protein